MKEVKLQIRMDKEIKDMWVKEARTLGMTLTDLIMDRMGASDSREVGVSWRGNDDKTRGRGCNGSISVSKTDDVGSTPTGPAISKKSQIAWKHVKKEYI